MSKAPLGKYIDMPKGVKPAPPQQSTLGEMWGKKKKREPEAIIAHENKMDVDKTGARPYWSKLACLDASQAKALSGNRHLLCSRRSRRSSLRKQRSVGL